MELFEWLTDTRVVSPNDVLAFHRTESSLYYKLGIHLTNDTLLYASEYPDKQTRTYSFHWQHSDGTLIRRWDNAPHVKQLASYPHHVHTGPLNGVIESHDIGITEVVHSFYQP
ncbi:DUF6516 family protein [Larkinella ripae]